MGKHVIIGINLMFDMLHADKLKINKPNRKYNI